MEHKTYYSYLSAETREPVKVKHRDELPDYVEKYWVHEPVSRDHVVELAHQNCPRCQPKGQLIDGRKTA